MRWRSGLILASVGWLGLALLLAIEGSRLSGAVDHPCAGKTGGARHNHRPIDLAYRESGLVPSP